MEVIVLHLRPMRKVRGISLAYVVRQLIKVAHIFPEYNAYLDHDKEMTARAPKVDTKLNIQKTKDLHNKNFVDFQCDRFKIDNALVHNIVSDVFTDMFAYVYKKQRKSILDS